MVKLPFGKKKEAAPKVSPEERVRTLSAQGLPETEIIRTLRSEGYKPMEVDKAMRESLKAAVAPARPAAPPARPEERAPPGPPGLPPLPEERPPVEERAPPGLEMPEIPGARPPPPPEEELPPLGPPPGPAPAAPEWRPPARPEEELEIPALRPRRVPREGREVEEVAEAIVDERTRELGAEIDRVSRKLEQVASKVAAIETSLGQIKGVKVSEVEEIKSSIAEYRQGMDDMASKIEAMERAVKDSLTPMMQSLRSLSETIKTLKKK